MFLLHNNLHFGIPLYSLFFWIGRLCYPQCSLTRCFCYKITFISGMPRFSNYSVCKVAVAAMAILIRAIPVWLDGTALNIYILRMSLSCLLLFLCFMRKYVSSHLCAQVENEGTRFFPSTPPLEPPEAYVNETDFCPTFLW